MNIFEKFHRSRTQENTVLALMETLYSKMVAVMDSLPQIRQEDFDLETVRTQLLLPVADYLTGQTAHFIKPLFFSGTPGIGKTTLLMVLDEVLYRLNASCRAMVVSGKLMGYFTDKPGLLITPLRLFGKPTAVLSARDWNNILRHWTFDESIARYSDRALLDFRQRLQGKVVILDEAELEGYVYFSELLAQHGILVILSSNLAQDQIHLAPEHVRVITMHGSDHRHGDISRVCLPNAPHPLFDMFENDPFVMTGLRGTQISRAEIDGRTLIYLKWNNLENLPLMKDDFVQCFMETGAEAVLLDAVPFFAEINAESVSLTFLGYLSRFVNFVDAIHDCQLPLFVRGTHLHTLDAQTAGSHLLPVLIAYDQRIGDHDGQAAWIEWARCLSRLRSRETINAQVWPLPVS